MKTNHMFWILLSFGFLQEGSAVIEDVAAGRGQFATTNYAADRALDGNTNPDIAAGFCARSVDTSGQDKAWWMVDLGGQYTIRSVTIYSKENTEDEQYLGYISVRVSDSDDIRNHVESDQCALWDNERFPANSNQTLECDQVMYGRYVSIQRTGGRYTYKMYLCEVMVMGEREGVYEDVAAGRGQFATCITRAEKALDGNTNPDMAAGYCAYLYVNSPGIAWWMVDLGGQYAIHSVIIYSRDNTQHVYYDFYLGYISVRVSDSDDIRNHADSDQCARWDKERFPANSSQTLECDQVMYGRYVSIQRTGGLWAYNMYLCEVMVMGERADPYDTECSNCNSDSCSSDSQCAECKPGLKPLECKTSCDSGDYGVNCEDECSEGCEDTCDIVSGKCSCKEWWDGDKCTVEIKELGLPDDAPTVSSVTDSSVTIVWRIITNVPDELADHYQYVIEYKKATSSNWLELEPVSHKPLPDQEGSPTDLMFQLDDAPDQYQKATLTGLEYNTGYDIHVKSYRVLGTIREQTGVTVNSSFQTKCRAPSKPRDLNVFPQKTGDKVTLTITWEHPEIIGCNHVTNYNVWLRRKAAAIDDWVKRDSISSCHTSYTLENLESGSYVVRVLVVNDGDSSSFAELASEHDEGTGSGNTGLIVGLLSAWLLPLHWL